MERFVILLIVLVVATLCFSAWRLRDRVEIIREFMQFLRERKLWWLAPMLLIFVLAGIFVAVAANSPIAAFLYVLH